MGDDYRAQECHPQASLQSFAWMEEHRERLRAARAAQCSSEVQRETVLAEPVFCFETACKTLYWSLLVYRIQARLSSTALASDLAPCYPSLRYGRQACLEEQAWRGLCTCYEAAPHLQQERWRFHKLFVVALTGRFNHGRRAGG